MSTTNWIEKQKLLDQDGPICLIIKANLKPVGELDRFQPAGFPEIGHVIYDAPRGDNQVEKVCIVDSPASMANHLETVCLNGTTGELHDDLKGLPYVRCVTDKILRTENGEIKLDPTGSKEKVVVTSFTEGHRIASDYFLDGTVNGNNFRKILRNEFKIQEVKKDKTYFIYPETWWSIYSTIFKYDPNTLLHGVLFAKEQIKISRFLTAHLEAFGASRVGMSGVKFDRLGKTTSGQPIFSVDEETANEIRATFILDFALLRSYGRDENGLKENEKKLLLDLALWKIGRLLSQPYRFRTQCFLICDSLKVSNESGELIKFGAFKQKRENGKNFLELNGIPIDNNKESEKPISDDPQKENNVILKVDIQDSITKCKFSNTLTDVYYPANELFKPGKETESTDDDSIEDNEAENEE